MPISTFDVAACNAALDADSDVFQIDAVAACDSTNTQLMHLAESGTGCGTVLIADAQTAGRGRRQRAWISSAQHSLTFSLLWRFASASRAPEALSLTVGLALLRALDGLGKPGIKASVKWPNDIVCAGRKLAGILIETQPGDVKSCIIGIGMNLRLAPDMPIEIADNAIALDTMLSAPPARETLLALVLKQLAATLKRYEIEGFAALRAEWLSRHAFQDRPVRVSGGSADAEGICVGVSESGELLVDTAEGVRRVISGDVSLRSA